MFGAIIGDVVGSIYEFNNIHTTEFELMQKDMTFTDDTVMTIAVADALTSVKNPKPKDIVKYMKKWGKKYPNAGYGCMFNKWLKEEDPKPYGSYGNGAAMRISPVASLSRTIKDLERNVKLVTEVSHNHPEGIKGAMVVAKCIWYAIHRKDKQFIKDFASKYYDLNLDIDELRKHNKHSETCQDTVPQAIYCFLISNNFEEALRNAISIGGDSDTIADMTCSIAEAYYLEVDRDLIDFVAKKIPIEMVDVINKLLVQSDEIIMEYQNDYTNRELNTAMQTMVTLVGTNKTVRLINLLCDSVNHLMKEKGVLDIRSVEIKFNNFFSVWEDLVKNERKYN